MISIETPQITLFSKEGWQKWKLAHAFNLIGSGTTPPTGSVEYFQGKIPWVNTGDLNDGYIYSVKKFVSEKAISEFSALKIFPQHSLIIAMYGATIGKLGILQVDACTNQACCILAKSNHLDIKFVFYSLISDRNNIIELAQGGGQPNISQEIVKNLRVFAPNITTQKSIAHFLDRKTATIDTLIAKKQRLIQLLEEKRTALINQAVTKGLNPNAPMKDSGIPSIGEIPEYWEVARLKWKITYVDQGRSPVCANRLADDGEWGVLKVGCVNGGVFNELEHKAFPEDLLKDFEHDIYKFQIHPGDILVSRANTKELVGSAARVGSIQSKLMLCDKLYRLHLSGKVDSEFLTLILNSRLARCQFEQESSGASGSMQNISHDKLSNLLLPFPPNQTEQVKINTVFQERSLVLQSSKLKLFEQIEKLQEYRRSLITSAVTGKLEIQEVT